MKTFMLIYPCIFSYDCYCVLFSISREFRKIYRMLKINLFECCIRHFASQEENHRTNCLIGSAIRGKTKNETHIL